MMSTPREPYHQHLILDCKLCGHSHMLHETCVHPLAGQHTTMEGAS